MSGRASACSNSDLIPPSSPARDALVVTPKLRLLLDEQGVALVAAAIRQAFTGIAAGNAVAEHRPDGPVDVADRLGEANLLAPLQGREAAFDQLDVEGLGDAMVLGLRTTSGGVGRHRVRQDQGAVRPGRVTMEHRPPATKEYR